MKTPFFAALLLVSKVAEAAKADWTYAACELNGALDSVVQGTLLFRQKSERQRLKTVGALTTTDTSFANLLEGELECRFADFTQGTCASDGKAWPWEEGATANGGVL